MQLARLSPNGNDLELAPPGGAAHHPDKGVNASAAWRQYHLTESRMCEPGSAARLCAGPIADA